jgi:hypothetical protein
MWISEIEGTKHDKRKNWIQKLADHFIQKNLTSKKQVTKIEPH